MRKKRRHAERVRVMNDDGEYHWYNYVIIKLDEDKRDPLTEYASGFVSVDEEVRREEAYRNALDEVRLAQEASRLKTMFVQNISHDIRTPLNAIVGFSQLLTLPGDLVSDEEKAQYSEYIKDSTDLLTMIINDVLSMSDVEKGILNVTKSPVSCNEICRKSVNCSTTRTPQGVRMYYTTEVEDDYNLNTDPMRVQQILVNFLSNACKHTEAGEIHVHCSIRENPGYVTFSVTDTGEGIKEDMANDIFERFITMDSLQDGHGMGLNICKDLSERLGGFVRLDKTYTSGARFVLLLPADELKPVSAEALQKLTEDMIGLWEFDHDDFYVIGDNKPSCTNNESGLDSLQINEDKTLKFNVHFKDGLAISTPGYYTVSDDGMINYRLWDGAKIIECRQRHMMIQDGKLIVRVEKENFDNHMKYAQENNILCDYCLTIFNRVER